MKLQPFLFDAGSTRTTSSLKLMPTNVLHIQSGVVCVCFSKCTYVVRVDYRNVCLSYAATNRADHFVLSCKTRMQGSNLKFFSREYRSW
jgi:hypothetical protein